MTVSNHTALYQFSFPEVSTTETTPLSPLIVVDLMDLPRTRSEASITLHRNTSRISGNGVFEPSFGTGKYRSYFCMDFKGAKPRDIGIFTDIGPTSASDFGDGEKLTFDTPLVNNKTGVLADGAWAQFEKPESNNQILVRVGMSFISEDKACANAEREIPNFEFDTLVQSAESAWKDKLSTIEIDPGDVSDSLLTAFWSGVYRTMISPQDYTGENPLWDSDEPYYDSFYCIWDSLRSIHPFITLVDPQSQTLMVRSLLDIYKHTGWLPDCRMSLCKGFTQGGSNADVVITDAYLKDIRTGIDWTLAYEALLKDAEIEPPNWDVEGRGGLESWKAVGYIPLENVDTLGLGLETRSISRTVEYAYNDFVIALLARELGHKEDYAKYLDRSGNWRNLFKTNQRSAIDGVDTGFVGFLQPRYVNGTWGYQDPIFCSPLMDFTGCYLNWGGGETYEGPVWLYSFFAPGDMATLIDTMGGPDTFTRRLDFLHESGLLYMGDEQAFLKVFLYHYAGRPGLSAKRARSYIPSQFNDTLGGIPGNDDSGAMGSFQALTLLGIFPNAGQDVYFITPPFFKEISIRNGQTGKTATIRNINFDTEGQNIYIQSAKLNGKPYSKNWLQHKFFLEGGVLELTLGPRESSWGTRREDLPPSLSPVNNVS